MNVCADCKTTRTPLWRTGPAGPRTLCNACGIRHRKRKVMAEKNPDEKPNCDNEGSKIKGDGDNDGLDRTVKMELGIIKEMMMQSKRAASRDKRQRSDIKLGEVEQAAFLLMCLSCGSVLA